MNSTEVGMPSVSQLLWDWLFLPREMSPTRRVSPRMFLDL